MLETRNLCFFMEFSIFHAYFHSEPLHVLLEICQDTRKWNRPYFPTSPLCKRFFFVSSILTPGFPNGLFFSFIMYAVLPASGTFIHLIVLHALQDTEVARVTMHISRMTIEVIHLNNTPKLVLNILKHISIWQIIILLDSLFLRMYQVKNIQNRL